MDRAYDCKRVLAPTSLPPHLGRELEEMAATLADGVGLSGIMDVEVLLHEDQLKVLEIDARLPSQTPATVYHSTGLNMVERLAALLSPGDGAGTDSGPILPTEDGEEGGSDPALPVRGSILEHIRVAEGHLSVGGERMMAGAGSLHLEKDFFGAEEALTNHAPGKDDWVATLVVTGADLAEAWNRRGRIMEEIQVRCGVSRYSDEDPDPPFGTAR
jgi:pyrrolysine biosynthesis protein PylC